MVEFLKNAMDWALEKEDEVAKNCNLKPEDVEKQIDALEKKREELRKRFEDQDAEFAHILSKLSIIKAHTTRCENR